MMLLLVACGREQAEDLPLPTVAQSGAAVVVQQATLIPPPSSRPTAVPTLVPTFTEVPVKSHTAKAASSPTEAATPTATATPIHPLMIEVMREQTYAGSDITFEQTLEDGVNYDRHIVSYLSEGNKIFALLTIPWGEKPATGWPVVIFNHGYIPPAEYRTTERYVAYVDAFARNGYIVFRSDYRGHGSSEGEATGGYSSPAYTIDVLNGLASVKALSDADPERIGLWGHSMGGHITLRAMVVSTEIKAGVIWAGVVASYPDLFERWSRRFGDGPTPTPNPTRTRGWWRLSLTETYGSLEENPQFWASISSNSYLSDLSGPLQLHHGTADASVPVEYSQTLLAQVQAVGLPVELYLYEGDNHNISLNIDVALQRSVRYFDQYVKGEG
jgi:dipeptidyl aminopeptidase/acylaminoacyl peptidase